VQSFRGVERLGLGRNFIPSINDYTMILLFRHVNPIRTGPLLRSLFHVSRPIKSATSYSRAHFSSRSLSTKSSAMATITLKDTDDKVRFCCRMIINVLAYAVPQMPVVG
jgi:hypothetical protein